MHAVLLIGYWGASTDGIHTTCAFFFVAGVASG